MNRLTAQVWRESIKLISDDGKSLFSGPRSVNVFIQGGRLLKFSVSEYRAVKWAILEDERKEKLAWYRWLDSFGENYDLKSCVMTRLDENGQLDEATHRDFHVHDEDAFHVEEQLIAMGKRR